jgi:hypothetical protein
MYKPPPDKRDRLSKLDILLALVPYLNFIVSISYLLRQESRVRGLKILVMALVVNSLCALANRLMFVRLSDLPTLAWLDKISWDLPSDWWVWAIILFVAASLAVRCVITIRLARSWRALAKRAGLDFKPGGCLGFSRRARVSGNYRGRGLSLYTYNPYLIDNVIDETRLELSVANPSDLGFRLEYMPAWRVVNQLFKERDQVQTGDEAFDAAFTLYSEDPESAASAFSPAELRQSLYRLRENTTIELQQTRLSLEHTGRERDADYLYFCFDVLSDLADAISYPPSKS